MTIAEALKAKKIEIIHGHPRHPASLRWLYAQKDGELVVLSSSSKFLYRGTDEQEAVRVLLED